MLRKSSCLALWVIVFALGAVSCVSAAEPLLISESIAQQHGLQRAWFAQANIDHGRSRLQDMNLYEGTLYLISDSAMVQAIDAETGATIWSKRIGQPNHPCLPLGVGGDMLAVVNGSRLYVANRYNGAIIYEHDVDGAPGGGPAVNDRRVYVPMTTGMVVAYRVDLLYDVNKEVLARKSELSPEELQQFEMERRQKIHVDMKPALPLFTQAKGRTLVQPLVMRQSNDEEYVSWPTDEGFLYIARVDRHTNRYLEIVSRIKTNAPIIVQPAYLPPTPKINPDLGVLFFGSKDGFVTAIQENGVVLWRFPTGEPIVQPPVSIGDRVYFSTQHGGLYCVDAMPDAASRAVRRWYAPGALQFLAAGKKHVYAADQNGNTLILDAVSGARVDSLETAKLSVKLMNSQTDRLYLAAPEGLVQCLHETGLNEPLRYDLDRKQAAEAAKPVAEKKAPGKTGEEGVVEKKAAGKASAKKATEDKGEKVPAPEKEPAAEEQPAPEEKPAPEKTPAPADKPAPDAGGDANPFGEK
jgi:outer membrane protein assembly factor BamB